jgi:hypothetical protein
VDLADLTDFNHLEAEKVKVQASQGFQEILKSP